MPDLSQIPDHGWVRSLDDGFCVECPNAAHAVTSPGAELVDEERQIYRKVFRKKKIYLPHQERQFVADHLEFPDSIALGMNGFSKITTEQQRRYGIEEGEYEAACSAILMSMIQHLRQKFPGAIITLPFGSSSVGVDQAILQVAEHVNLTPVGFSCPEFALYVDDDDLPMYIAETPNEYGDAFIRNLDLLIATGGRAHALQHDIAATCIYNKRIHFIDVLNALSRTGGVPATIIDADGKARIDNAAAAFGRNISFCRQESVAARVPPGGDRWDGIFNDVASVVTEVCRQKMSPKRKFRDVGGCK